MPTDRDLIAHARRYADLFTNNAVFSDAGKDGTRRLLCALADALEAAQRPLLGYVVLAKAPNPLTPYRNDYANPSIDVYPTEAAAHDARQQADAATTGRAASVYRDGLEHVVAEVRDVQP